MKFLSLFSLVLIIFFSTSCNTQKQAITSNYLQNAKDTSGKTQVNIQPPIVQKGDLLSIKVFSKANGLDPKADAPYNLQEQSAAGGGTNTSAGFLVDRNGNIEYPQLGLLHVEGLTREDLSELIRSKLDSVLTNPSVIVRFLNYKVTVLGEVKAPGSYTFQTENVSILDALGSSGDITDFGKKDNVMVIRENNGLVERGRINLTSDSLFLSPYYHLQQGDVVLVEAMPRKIRQQQEQQTAQRIGLGISIITAIALILTFFR
jgi:polysaccharide export outer membrane protein